MKLLIKLSYKGTNYSGYQVQNNAVTVQEKLNEAAFLLFGRQCDIVGCSRTDSGVHANEFYATVAFKGTNSLESKINTENFPLAFCAHLPPDISVNDAIWVNENFHPRYDVKFKEYLYKIWNVPTRNPFIPDMCYHYPKYIDDCTLCKLNEAAKYFIGEHDFTAFMAKGGNELDTVRDIKYFKAARNGDFIEFKIAADGFLYNMVRICVGTLLYVAEGKIKPENIPKIIESKNRCNAGFTVPASGLFLNKVEY